MTSIKASPQLPVPETMRRRAERERWQEAVEQDLMDRWKIIEAQQRRVLLSWRLEPCPDGQCEACEHTGLLPVALVGPPAECPHGWIVGKPKNGDPAFDWPFVRECLRLEQLPVSEGMSVTSKPSMATGVGRNTGWQDLKWDLEFAAAVDEVMSRAALPRDIVARRVVDLYEECLTCGGVGGFAADDCWHCGGVGVAGRHGRRFDPEGLYRHLFAEEA